MNDFDPTKKRILIIEDEALIVDMYKEKLKFEGFRVSTAMDGKKALTRAKQGADLILLDILMPGLNGFEVLKRLKSEKETQSIPVIVFTNMGTEVTNNDKNFALSLGAVDYMVKSLHTPDEVIDRIRTILSEAQ
jgi:DNA-binding response OmpR family regulator